ncbi:MAG TPA: hypothetical protein VN231_15245 [Allosphingosinicella sp.]|nr:hypothetical protein [Allosphingosinicella sp.]
MKPRIALVLLALAGAPAASAQTPAQAPTAGQVTAEYYYRIRWGSADEFKRLYERNHAPLLREMQRLGFITRIETEEPFTHLSGGARWDLRVTVTFRDADSAVLVGGPFDQAFASASARLYPDRTAFAAEEARRFALLEEHWDVIVAPVAAGTP